MTATTSSPSSPPVEPSTEPLPPLFGRETHLLGWQGLTATLPADWHLRSFEGKPEKGKLRVTDDEGLRLELLWNTPDKAADIAESVARFLESLEREATKAKRAFRIADHPDLMDKKSRQRTQVTTFGWIGEPGDPVASQGWGAAWQCTHCGRVTVAHIVGRSGETTNKMQRLARQIFSSLECHGSGGWQTWSVYGLHLEVPEEFTLGRAQLLTGRIDIEWLRVTPPLLPILPPWMARGERIAVSRIAPANVLLENETLDDWAGRALLGTDKKRRFMPSQEISIHGHPGWLFLGEPRDWRQRAWRWLQQRVGKKQVPPVEVRVWHCETGNKIYALDTELEAANAHVMQDVLDSLHCH